MSVEVAGQVCEFVLARLDGRHGADGKIALGDAARGGLQRANGLGDVTRQPKTQQAGTEQRDHHAHQRHAKFGLSSQAAKWTHQYNEEERTVGRVNHGSASPAQSDAKFRLAGHLRIFEHRPRTFGGIACADRFARSIQ